ncbi:PAS domain-containing protein [Candidatus Hamiltonella defensa]|uniref:Helix-turn-helix transcriptional regulator n=1 Tax=Candidatus Williamhamiltonella defendens TaxID=138072 RepID=A0AAC9VK80_9ENTR|nr:PAS and helix-turn-helix domain-containing protein [Candidatus Hamiltonella defensa]ASV33400.1 helix-turn-helix transcriptional regulator [Candidatus Hamiltonella defensa]AWK16347.1 helix-turn-helix transcriptional regulator [Candidatus Hamiltonella defensa]MBK4361662.1 PAS domain-containing protein [Candidatus Hamiltonella defensa]
MNEHQNSESKKSTVDSLGKVPMIAMMEHSKIPWGIKDNQSRYVYLNEAALDMANIPVGFDFEGRLDEEFPCPWSELAPEIYAQDRKAESSHQTAEAIGISYYTRQAVLEPYYIPKFPIYNQNGESLGTVFCAKKFSFISISDFFNHLKPSVLTLNPPVDTFTEKELDIIFYAFQKMSSKEIATKLCLSHRTIENRLQRIYEKMGVTSLAGLIEYCHTTGLNHHVPKNLLRQGIEFFW